MSEIKCGKRAKMCDFRFVGKISQKGLKKSLIFTHFEAKKLILGRMCHPKPTMSQSLQRRFREKRSQKVINFHSFSKTRLGFLFNILPQISQKELFFEMKSQMSTQSLCIEKTCFFIKNTKFLFCIFTKPPINQRLLFII